ncbi:MAG: hypothetical protein L6437_15385 [Kiritimatiellae bacterium]|nr:hypothetical protein [Kiritimatiellia bacterium]
MTALRLMMGFLLVCTAIQAAPKLSVVIQEPWSDVFGGKEAVFHVVISSREATRGRVVWRYAAGGKTIARQEREVSIAPSRPESVVILLPVPEVKEGVILSTMLSVSMIENGALQATVTLEKTLWVFPPDPFAGRQEWLKGLNLYLFDPEEKTAQRFKKAHIPFQCVPNYDALSNIRNGLVMIGEGISFKDYRGLWNQLMVMASNGVSVLCLAPAEGSLRLLAPDDPAWPAPAGMKLEQTVFIRRLDKRLDADAWPPDGVICARTFVVRGERGAVVSEIAPAASGDWSWIEIEGHLPRGRLIVCCFAMVEKWEVSPAPRFLLERILQYMSE